MISCPGRFNWSLSKAAQRQKKAELILGKKMISRIIGFAMFLLGAERKEIAAHVGISFNTFLSFLTRTNNVGIDGFRDRRESAAPVLVQAKRVSIETRPLEGGLALCLGDGGQEISLNDANCAQKKVLLLTFTANGLLSTREAAKLLGYTEAYVRDLVQKLSEGDVQAVLDKRTGQRSDYRVTEAAKGELIAQWAVNAVTGQATSSPALSKDLQKRCSLEISARTVRHHLKKLGITEMADKVNTLARAVKKGS